MEAVHDPDQSSVSWVARLVEVLQPLSLRADRLAGMELFAGLPRRAGGERPRASTQPAAFAGRFSPPSRRQTKGSLAMTSAPPAGIATGRLRKLHATVRRSRS